MGGQPIFAPMPITKQRKGPGGWRGLLRRLRSRYRLVLINDATFEERFTLRLNRLGVLVLAVVTLAIYGSVIVALIVFTPLKRYIPGYSDQETRMNAYRSTFMADSLTKAVEEQRRYIENLRAVLTGDLPADSASLQRPALVKPSAEDLRPGAEDSLLRAKLEQEDRYALSERRESSERRELATVLFVPPVQGVLTAPFDAQTRHYGVDLVTKPDEAIKCCLAGTITLATWTSDAGYVIQVQHTNGLVSVYKHNRVLLKKAGDRVKAGEAIAIVGDTGKETNGPHLHFELWHNGVAVDPAAYMVFQ
jgi:murein DD-endopeptidase MepM/ murein hydrolase activator NlpD